MGITHIRLKEADRDVLAGALRAAWTLRADKNRRGAKRPSGRPSAVRAAKAPPVGVRHRTS
jgi:hypothetical protein